MKLIVMLPSHILLEEEVTRLVAEAPEGFFGLLPHHIDFVSVLAPGIVTYETKDGLRYLAVDEGVLVKCGEKVMISTRYAAGSAELGTLEQAVRSKFRVLDEQSSAMRSTLARLEADFMRRFVELRRPAV